MRRRTWLVGSVLLLAGAPLGASRAEPRQSGAVSASAPPAQPGVAQPLPTLAPLVEAVGPTVVGVTTKQAAPRMNGRDQDRMRDFMERFFGGGDMPMPDMPGRGERVGLGSGVVIDAKGIVLTNNHVVEDADEVIVKTADGSQHEAQVLGTDPDTDVAVLQIKGLKSPLPAARLGRSDDLRVGDYVLAIGNPFGLEFTVTSGIISAKARELGAGPYDDFLQTDAAINPGNSGGPLFDLAGNVVGINTAIEANGQGIGFAVPIDLAKQLVPQLIKSGKVSRGYIGVSIQDLTPELAQGFDIKADRGALVAQVVPGGPGDKAGLQPGDVVTALQGQQVRTAAELTRRVAALPPGTQVKLSVMRKGKPSTVAMTLGERPRNPGQEGPEGKPAPGGQSALGLSLQGVPQNLQRQLGIPGGAQVTGVQPGSRADKAGLRPGDIVVEANHRPVGGPADLVAIVQQRGNAPLLLRVLRENSAVYIVVPPR